jgi:hypothetical protein
MSRVRKYGVTIGLLMGILGGGVIGGVAEGMDKNPPGSVVPTPQQVPTQPIAPAPLPANCCGGTADPVQLIASAGIQPFWGASPFITIFEITSLGENPGMHVFFFNASCQRVFSIPFRMTAHDVTIADTDELFAKFNGLAVFSKSSNAISAEALESPITLRGHRVDFLFDVINVVDPIQGRHAENLNVTWSPLRSGATTVTFPDAHPFSSTRWWVVCPQGNLPVDLTSGIPSLPPAPSLIRFRAFDLDENPIFDQQFTCNCLTEVKPGDLNPGFFAAPRFVEMVTYLSETPIANPPAFVLYRQLRFGPIGGFHGEDFGRAPGMSAATILSGEAVQLAR